MPELQIPATPSHEPARELIQGARLALATATENAALSLERAVAAAPRDLGLRQELACLLASSGRLAEAAAHLQAVAGAFAARGELFKALAVERILIALSPRPGTLEALADLHALRPAGEAAERVLPLPLAGALDARESGAWTAPAGSAQIDARLASLYFAARVQAPPSSPGVARNDEVAQVADPPAAPLFSLLERDTFLALADRLQLRWTRAGERIVEAGENGDSMFFIVQGALKVFDGRASPAEPVALLGAGSMFGEKALLGDSVRHASVIAAESGILFSLSRSALEELELAHPGLRRTIEGLFRERLLENLLEVSPIFRALEPDEKRRLTGKFWMRELQPGTTLLEQGQPGAGFFLLLRGSCEVFGAGEDGRRRDYPSMKTGDVFGEISLLFDSPCTASVRSATPCEVLVLPREDFLDLLLPNNKVRRLIEQLAAERLTRTADIMSEHDLALRSAELHSSWVV